MPTEPKSPLADYIAAAKAHGATDSFLVELLERNGWPLKEVYAAFDSVYAGLIGIAAPRRTSGLADSARDAFLYLLSFGTLGVWTIGLGSLLFTLIEIRFPDPVFANRYVNVRNSISGPMASLIVGFPAYLLTMRVLLRDLARTLEKADSPVRKWLTYIALLLSAGTVIGDLVTFVNYFLRGQLTTPFLLKVLAVLVIAGGVFWYYLTPLEKPRAAEQPA
jgi:membrane protein YqaA with SNARE-associated domain